MTDPSPKELRRAWLSMSSQIESQLGATLMHARTMRKMPASDREHTKWDATAWAASRLLDQVRGLPAPEVPVDPLPGQGSLEELLPEEEPMRR